MDPRRDGPALGRTLSADVLAAQKRSQQHLWKRKEEKEEADIEMFWQ